MSGYVPAPALIASRSGIPAGASVRDATIASASQSPVDLAACVLFTTAPTDRALAGWRGWDVPAKPDN